MGGTGHWHCSWSEWMISADSYREVLSDENFVDVHKLRKAASYGIPNDYRATVWKYLLGVTQADQSETGSIDRMMAVDYSAGKTPVNYELFGRVKRAVKQYRPDTPFFADKQTQTKLCNCILQHLNSNQVPFEPALVSLAAPFVFVFSKESDIYYCFQRLMERMSSASGHQGSSYGHQGSLLAKFIMLLRSLHPELSNHFEDEELEPNEWALSWLQQLLARELPIECVLRLWDTYLAIGQGDTLMSFHPYVCLAILSECEEELLETENPELKGALAMLPALQMDRIVTQAFNLREMASLSGLEQPDEEEEDLEISHSPPVLGRVGMERQTSFHY